MSPVGVAQWIEHLPPKQGAAGSIPATDASCHHTSSRLSLDERAPHGHCEHIWCVKTKTAVLADRRSFREPSC